MREYALFSKLPDGFTYPLEFLKTAKRQLAAPEPWLFINAASAIGKALYSLAQSEGRNLVPFASFENGDGDVACFDGSSTTVTPKVIMLILDESGRSYGFSNYSHWLEEVSRWS